MSRSDVLTFERDGFMVTARTVFDESPDLSYLGEWSDTPEAGAIDHRERTGERDVFRYFNPQLPDYAEADYKRMCAYDRGDWHMVGVCVVVSLDGVDLTDEYAHALWGIESDSDEDYLRAVAEDLAGEAIDAARARLASLCEAAKRTR